MMKIMDLRIGDILISNGRVISINTSLKKNNDPPNPPQA